MDRFDDTDPDLTRVRPVTPGRRAVVGARAWLDDEHDPSVEDLATVPRRRAEPEDATVARPARRAWAEPVPAPQPVPAPAPAPARAADPAPAFAPAMPPELASARTAATGTSAISATEADAPVRETGRTRGRAKPARAADDSPRGGWAGALLELVGIVVLALLLSFLLRTFVAQPFEVPSGSMENTLRIGDKIVAQKIVSAQRGDIVVFADTNGWLDGTTTPRPGPVRRALELIGLAPDSAQEHLVKRVVGMPGDRVKCCDRQGRMSINGLTLDESAYLYADQSGMVKASNVAFEVVVPEGHIFVMGDHRDASSDSRCHLKDQNLQGEGAGAFVPLSSVVGTVPAVFMPLDRVRRFDNPAVFRAVPAPQQAPPQHPVIVKAPERC